MVRQEFELIPFGQECNISIKGHVWRELPYLYVDVNIDGDLGDLSFMGAESSLREKKEGLWNHTCFEIFVKDSSSTRYLEWNFAPSGDWWCMMFSDYRQRMEVDSKLSPQSLHWKRSEGLTGSFVIPFVFDNIKIGICCVVETEKEKTYWALKHSKNKPDFHDSFELFL
jgi:hypothetical protein